MKYNFKLMGFFKKKRRNNLQVTMRKKTGFKICYKIFLV